MIQLRLDTFRLRIEFCTGGCQDRSWAREAEEFPLLETVARERMIKAKQAGKSLADAVVICKVCRLAILS
jgi:hypothetical protein